MIPCLHRTERRLLRFVVGILLWGWMATGLFAGGATAAQAADPTTDPTESSVEAPDTTAWLEVAVLPFGVGESFTFTIGYGMVKAGEARIAIEDSLTYFGQNVLEVVTRARSNRFFDAFFRVRDQAVSYIDADSLFSRYYAKHLREGGYQRDVEIHFDHLARIAYFPSGKENVIPFGVHDVLSAFFRVRTLDLTAGSEYSLPTHGDKRMYDLRVLVRQRERVKNKVLGEVDCVVVQPILGDEGLFQSSGELLVWFTDDDRRIPVRLRAKVPVGAIEANLSAYHPPTRPLDRRRLQKGAAH